MTGAKMSGDDGPNHGAMLPVTHSAACAAAQAAGVHECHAGFRSRVAALLRKINNDAEAYREMMGGNHMLGAETRADLAAMIRECEG